MAANDIHRFARLGNLEALAQELGAGIDINLKDDFGSSALHCAIAEKQAAAVKLLLQFDADVSAQDANGLTALHYAIAHKVPDVLEALLQKCPAAVSVSDKHGNQPLWTAAFNARGDYKLVSLLLQYGADPAHCNNVGLSPLDIPKRKGEPALLQLLESHLSDNS